MLLTLIFLAHVGATMYMTGLIWFVQLVHYPLFAEVGRDSFARYESLHTRWTTFAVGPMFLEALTLPVLFLYAPAAEFALLAWIAVALVAVNIASTAFFQVPQHSKLVQGFDADAHRFLVRSNWIRTAAWSLRSAILLGMMGLLLEG